MRFSLYTRIGVAVVALLGTGAFVLQTELSALLCPLVVVLVPLSAAVLWIYKKSRPFAYPNEWRKVLLGTRVVSTVGWFLCLLPGLFWGALFLHISDPWPLSLMQGPDTESALEGFGKVMHSESSENVDEIYYKGIDIRDQDRRLKFTTCDSSFESRILSDLERQKDGVEPEAFHLNNRLKWWFTASEAASYEHWAREYQEIWIDRSTCTYFVRSWTT